MPAETDRAADPRRVLQQDTLKHFEIFTQVAIDLNRIANALEDYVREQRKPFGALPPNYLGR
jgi:hypothetical protein